MLKLTAIYLSSYSNPSGDETFLPTPIRPLDSAHYEPQLLKRRMENLPHKKMELTQREW